MRNNRYCRAQCRFIDLGYIHAVNSHFSLGRIVKSGNKINQGGFSGAGRADNSNSFARIYMETDMTQCFFARFCEAEGIDIEKAANTARAIQEAAEIPQDKL